MSRGAELGHVVGVTWTSTNFRALLIGDDGTSLDEYDVPRGVLSLDRVAMADLMRAVSDRWSVPAQIYASGMIGSTIGWSLVPYVKAPADAAALKSGALKTNIGGVSVRILPGVSCRRADGEPDVLRGEEIELLGSARLIARDGLVVLPGKHSKWAWLQGEQIGEFFTSMSGELYESLSANGLLASILEGEAREGASFEEGVTIAFERRLSLSTLLFGARARVMQGDLEPVEVASYLRGLLIGAEIGDAVELYPQLSKAPVIISGSSGLGSLYASALSSCGISNEIIDARRASLLGFRAIHEAGVD